DTNPVKEETAYVESIKEDVRWLGFDWGEHLYFASDNFAQLYDWAEHLIDTGNAYVDDLSAEEIREYRGTLTEPGRNSPHRDRPAEEIMRSDVIKLRSQMKKEISHITANRYVALLGKLFSLAVEWGICGDNPARGVKPYEHIN
ncbi:MAG: hypothetical protein IIB77_05835, partial [Proteobacteria bacterium]|nr:hypothetical protein [Pseudomonadota bacterium]